MSELNQKQTTILIQTVDNGFIVTEDFSEYPDLGRLPDRPLVKQRKVFNTKKSLYNYIAQNL